MPSQKLKRQVLIALQHAIPEACQNFSDTWEICAKKKKCFQLLIQRQLSGRTRACLRWNTQRAYHPAARMDQVPWSSTNRNWWTQGKYQQRENKARTKMEQEPRIMRKSRQDPDAQLQPRGLWSSSEPLKKFPYSPVWWVQTSVRSKPAGEINCRQVQITHNPYNLLSTWQCTRLLCFSKEDAYFNLQAPQHSYCFMLSLKKSFS